MGISVPPDIGELKAIKNVKGLIKALKSKDRNVRRSAVEALGEIKDARAVEPLIEALKDEDKYFQSVAARCSWEDREVIMILEAVVTLGLFGLFS